MYVILYMYITVSRTKYSIGISVNVKQYNNDIIT